MDFAEIATTFLQILPQALMSGVALGSVYALIAQGYYVTFTTTETVNFAQGEFLMVGALASYSLMVLSGLANTLGPVITFLITLLTVFVLMAVMGTITERIAIRPLRQLLSVGWILSTVGLSVILQKLCRDLLGPRAAASPLHLWRYAGDNLRNWHLPAGDLPALASLSTMAAVLVFLKRSALGKALAAVAYNPTAAGLMGIDVRRMIILAYVISSILAGLAGILVAPVIFAHSEMERCSA